MEARNLAERYDAPLMQWSQVEASLDAGFDLAPGGGGPDRHSAWLATIDADGRPHVTGLGVLWESGDFWFETGASTRKGRNLTRDPRCTLSIALRDLDLTVEGRADVVRDPETVARLAATWAEGGWPCEPDETGTRLTAPFSAPSAGGPPWDVWRFTVERASAVLCVAPGGATRWEF